MHPRCPECGFQNPEAVSFCSKCGARLVTEDPDAATTMSFSPDEALEESSADADLRVEGTALVVRSGGGRAGETFLLENEQTSIGRSPDSDVFLDDVTVSRNHAAVRKGATGCMIEDLGSLNGTYVNRRRVEIARLENGDEVQIGKYRLAFLDN